MGWPKPWNRKKFKGIVPDDVDKLQELPGVGRKTANVIAAVVYDKPTMAVDTHVHRVAARIGLAKNAKTPLETEKQLVAFFPADIRAKAHHWLILHGRYTCKARKPECEKCGLPPVCAYYKLIQKGKQRLINSLTLLYIHNHWVCGNYSKYL